MSVAFVSSGENYIGSNSGIYDDTNKKITAATKKKMYATFILQYDKTKYS